MGAPENPPAFPVSSIDGFTQHGMDLRDWFAGQALSGWLASFNEQHPTSLDQLAGYAFDIADAMLTARQSQEPPHEG